MGDTIHRLSVVSQVAGPVLRQLLEDLHAQGVEPELLAGWLDAEAGERVPFLWRRACPLWKSPAWRRGWTWAWFTAAAKWFLAFRCRRPAFIETNPPLVMLAAPWIRTVLGLPYVLRVCDVFPDALERMGIIRRGGVLSRLWRRCSRWAMLRARAVVTIGPHMAERLRGHLRPGDEVAIEVIPNWADTDFIRPLPREQNAFAREHGLADKFVVMYSGSLGATHDLDSIAAAAEALRDLPDVRLVIIGGGTRRREMEELVARKALPNLLLLPLQPYSVVPQSLSAADCAIVCLEEAYAGVSMPGKTYSMMAAGAAILAVGPEDSELADVVRDFSCGVHIRPRDPAALASAVRRLHADPRELEAMKLAARRAAEEHFSRRRAGARYVEFLRRAFGWNAEEK